MLRGITVALVAALTFSLTTAAAPAADSVRDTTTVSGANERGWHITGRWKGIRDNTLGYKMRAQLRIRRNDAGTLRGTGVYRTTGWTKVCDTRLRFVKRTKDGSRVFRERDLDHSSNCGNARVRMERRPRNRLKVRWFDGSGIPEEGTLHRP